MGWATHSVQPAGGKGDGPTSGRVRLTGGGHRDVDPTAAVALKAGPRRGALFGSGGVGGQRIGGALGPRRGVAAGDGRIGPRPLQSPDQLIQAGRGGQGDGGIDDNNHVSRSGLVELIEDGVVVVLAPEPVPDPANGSYRDVRLARRRVHHHQQVPFSERGSQRLDQAGQAPNRRGPGIDHPCRRGTNDGNGSVFGGHQGVIGAVALFM